MASLIQHVSALFIASLLLFLSCPSLGNAAQLIEGVCKNTINKTECLTILNSDPRARSASNYKVLAQAVLDLAIENAKDSQAFINNLVKSDPREAIKACASSYQAVVGSFNSAKGEIEEDPMTANYDSKIAGDDARECETSLSMKGVKVPEISARNNVVQLFSSIADVVTDHLE